MEISDAIKKASNEFGIRTELIAGVIMEESSGNPWAISWEPGFYETYVANVPYAELQGFKPPRAYEKVERMERAVGWGLMQLMGQVAREHGYQQLFLSELLRVEDNVHYGTKFLRWCVKHRASEEGALLRYNGGADTQYPSRVYGHIKDGSIGHVLTP